MTNDALSSPLKDAYTLVEIWYGDLTDPSYIRLTNWSNNSVYAGQEFEHCPEMRIELPKYIMTIDAEQCKITIPKSKATALHSMTYWKSHPQIFVKIIEISYLEGKRYADIVFFGRGISLKRNPSGNKDLIEVRGSTIKSFLNGRCGIQCEPQCQWGFGTSACGVDVPTREFQIDSIDQTEVTGTWIGAANPKESYARGWLLFEGTKISIREGSNPFYTTVPVPRDWIGETVLAHSGCTKDYDSCEFWENESRFMGIGYDIPPYQPLLEDPGI